MNTTTASLMEQAKSCRRTGVPLVRVPSADVPAAEAEIKAALGDKCGVLRWSPSGLAALNDRGKDTLNRLSQDDRDASTNPMAALEALAKVGPDTVTVAWNLYAYAEQIGPALASQVLTLREPYKATRRILAAVGYGTTPDALTQDVMTLSHPLPDDAALEKVVRDIHQGAGVELDPAILSRAVDSIRGLYAYAAESIIATSISREGGLDLGACWAGKAASLPRGLTLEMLPDAIPMGGLVAARDYLGRRFLGPNPPRAILLWDEVEKSMGGLGQNGQAGDNTGTAQEQFGSMLSWMDGGQGKRGATGAIIVGVPGTGKTLLAQVLASLYRVPLLRLSMSALKTSALGGSQEMMAAVLAAVDRIASGACYILATSNGIDQVPFELKRRFQDGIVFVDIPSPEDQEPIWQIQLKRAGLPLDSPRPDFTQWTGSDIRSCCESARDRMWTLADASQYLTPVAKTDVARIDRLRDQAHGRWVDAARGGLYKRADTTAPDVSTVTVSRRVMTDDSAKKEN